MCGTSVSGVIRNLRCGVVQVRPLSFHSRGLIFRNVRFEMMVVYCDVMNEITAAWICSIIRHSMDNLLNFTCLGLMLRLDCNSFGSSDRLHPSPSLKLFVAARLHFAWMDNICSLFPYLPICSPWTILLMRTLLYRLHHSFAGEFEMR